MYGVVRRHRSSVLYGGDVGCNGAGDGDAGRDGDTIFWSTWYGVHIEQFGCMVVMQGMPVREG